MFSKLEAKNLFSWESLEYSFVNGISQITGINYDDGGISEGSGKSSIPNILSWVAFGMVPKDVRIDDVIRRGTKKASGTLTLENGSRIVRTRGPNDLALIKSDGSIVKGKDAKETQILINKSLGMNFETFCQSVYFAQNNPNKFIQVNEATKAQVLSEIQDLTVFDKARKKAQDSIKVLQAELSTGQKHLVLVEGKIETYTSNKALLLNFIEKFEDSKKNKLKALRDHLNNLDLSLTSIKEAFDKESTEELNIHLENVESSIKEANLRKSKLANALNLQNSTKASKSFLNLEIKKKQAKYDELKTFSISDSAILCKHCGSPITHKNLVGIKVKELEELNDELLKLNALLTDYPKEDLDELETRSLIEKENLDLVNMEDLKQRLWVRKNNIVHQKSQYNKLLETSTQVQHKILDEEKAEPTEELLKLSKLEETLKAETEILKHIQTEISQNTLKLSRLEVIKDGFKEVKQYVFQSLLADLSSKTTSIASELFEIPIAVRFSNDSSGEIGKIQTTVRIDNEETSLGLLSGGQYKRVELSVDLALSSIIASRAQNPINLRILDEPLQNLSLTSKEKVVILLEGLGGKTILIDHDPIIKNIVNSTFDIVYKDGISKVCP